AAYRGAFERYLRFLYFFYDHNADPDSYFWEARKILHHAPGDMDARTSFVRLMSGGADRLAIPALVEHEHARWTAAIASGRASAIPGVDLLRVAPVRRLVEGSTGYRPPLAMWDAADRAVCLRQRPSGGQSGRGISGRAAQSRETPCPNLAPDPSQRLGSELKVCTRPVAHARRRLRRGGLAIDEARPARIAADLPAVA